MKKSKLLFKNGEDWTPELLEKIWKEIEIVAKELQVSYYPPQFEIISANQMLDIYTSVGMPAFYKHWSFGKQLIQEQKAYNNGEMGLAYELVINSDPCIAFLMEQNSTLMQTLVMAHASVGHSAVFKNNIYFQQNTDAEGIIDYLNFAKEYIAKCEEKYGYEAVEEVLDACHSVQQYSVDKYRRKPKRLKVEDEAEGAWKSFDMLTHTLLPHQESEPLEKAVAEEFEPQENLLYFIEKNSPYLQPWKKEILRIVRKIAQYFYPQMMTNVVNEGYASFTHHYILNRLWDKGLIDTGSMLEFIHSHSGVLRQGQYRQFNPYRLGFAIYTDIRRICTNPTDEDRELFPNLIGKNWVEEVNYAMKNFNNESFIQQYLSPTVAKDFGIFTLSSDTNEGYSTVLDISDIAQFRELRERLARTYSISYTMADIQVVGVSWKGTRTLNLKHFHDPKSLRTLNLVQTAKVVNFISKLWGFPVTLETISANGERVRVASDMYAAFNK